MARSKWRVVGIRPNKSRILSIADPLMDLTGQLLEVDFSFAFEF
jgi:hypothetical protein